MSLNVNGYNDTFQSFVDFAKIRNTMGDKTAIARVTTGVNVAEGALAGRTITASDTDSIRGLFKWFRSADDEKNEAKFYLKTSERHPWRARRLCAGLISDCSQRIRTANYHLPTTIYQLPTANYACTFRPLLVEIWYNSRVMFDGLDKETKAYLARIRKTIEDSQHLVEQAGLRIRETDRMLEQQGLTREQVMAMHFSDAQIEAANAELKRRGLDPLEKWAMSGDEGQGEGGSFYAGRETTDSSHVSSLSSEDFAPDAELAERQRKFGMMMKPFQI